MHTFTKIFNVTHRCIASTISRFLRPCSQFFYKWADIFIGGVKVDSYGLWYIFFHILDFLIGRFVPLHVRLPCLFTGFPSVYTYPYFPISLPYIRFLFCQIKNNNTPGAVLYKRRGMTGVAHSRLQVGYIKGSRFLRGWVGTPAWADNGGAGKYNSPRRQHRM